MKHLIILFFLMSFLSGFSQNVEVSELVIGEVLTFDSEILGEERELNIYLPQTYESGSDSYPVIYLLDGTLSEDFIHIAGLTQFGSFPWVKLNPECIVVGISNIDRTKDFSFPTNNEEDLKNFPTSGKSASFISYLKDEVKPMVESKYRINKSSTLIGQSMGGLLATEILFKNPDLFDNYIIVSPSLWWDDQSLLEIEPKPFEGKKKIYITVGKEGKEMVDVSNELYNKVKAYKNEDTQTFYRYEGALNHANILHQAVYNAFEKIFKEKQTEMK